MSSFTSSTSTLSPSSSPILKKKKNDLLSLPPPVLLRLLSFLPLPDLVRSVSLTCRRFKLLASHPQLFEQKLARLGHPKYTKLTLPSYLQASWLHLNFDSELPPKTLYKVIYERWFPFFRQFQDSNWKISPFWKSFKDKTMPAQYLPFFPAFQKTMNTENEHEILGNLKEGIQLFESELLQSFDQSHQVNNEQDMKMLAWALYFLNGGQSCLQLYMFKLPIFFDENKDVAGNFKALSMEGGDAQSPLAVYLEDLSFTMQEYLPKIASIFPDPMTFQYTFVQKVFDELISEYLQRLLKEAHQRDYSLFLQTLTVMFTHCSKWIVSLAHVLNTKKLEKLLDGSVHQFIEQYMDFERLHFTQECTSKLKQWSSTCTDQFLNLDVILECIAFNREAIKRCIVMMQRKGDIRPHIETLFTLCLQLVGQHHVKPGFQKAIDLLKRYDQQAVLKEEDSFVVPFPSFFAMIKVGDQILSTIQTYFAEEIVPYLHTPEPYSMLVQVQKQFDRHFDDGMAQGLDQAMLTLLHHVETTLEHHQLGTDYDPPSPRPPAGSHSGRSAFMNPVGSSMTTTTTTPTLACVRTLATVQKHVQLFTQVADKSLVSVFCAELGTRLWQLLCQHIKKMRINVQGGFRLMSDVNEYYRWSTTLSIEALEPYYVALKSIVHVYIVTDMEALKALVKDHERYHGVFHVEEVYAFIARRSDYEQIKSKVKENECCIM